MRFVACLLVGSWRPLAQSSCSVCCGRFFIAGVARFWGDATFRLMSDQSGSLRAAIFADHLCGGRRGTDLEGQGKPYFRECRTGEVPRIPYSPRHLGKEGRVKAPGQPAGGCLRLRELMPSGWHGPLRTSRSPSGSCSFANLACPNPKTVPSRW